jgi:cell wall assembly regulator SMI1
MKETWNRIEKWLQNNASKVLENLSPGTNEDKIREFENLLDIKMAADLKESYLIHNGQITDRYPLIDDWNLLSLDNAMNEWKLMKNLHERGDFDTPACASEGVSSDWWNIKWLPILSNGSGDFYCVDFAPTSEGNIGQIIHFSHVDSLREKISNNWYDLLLEYALSLENGRYKFRNDVLKKVK